MYMVELYTYVHLAPAGFYWVLKSSVKSSNDVITVGRPFLVYGRANRRTDLYYRMQQGHFTVVSWFF